MSLAVSGPSFSPPIPHPSLDDVLTRGDIWRGDRLATAGEVLSTGYALLDAALPGGGWPGGSLVDVMQASAGIGELQLLLPALARLTACDQWAVLQAPPWQVFAPAWQAGGVRLSRLVVFRPEQLKKPADQLWAAEQILRAGSVGIALLWLPRATTAAHLRRLQVAAEAGGCTGFFLQDESRLAHPSAAPLRLRLEAHVDGLLIHVVKRRGAPLARPLLLPLTPAGSRCVAAAALAPELSSSSSSSSSSSWASGHALARARFPQATA